MHLTKPTQVRLLGSAAINTDGWRVRPGEIHNDLPEVAVLLGPSEECVYLAPGSELRESNGPSMAPSLTSMAMYVSTSLAWITADEWLPVAGVGTGPS